MIISSFSPLISKRPHKHLADMKDSLHIPVIFANQLKGLMKPPWTVISIFFHSKCFLISGLKFLPFFWLLLQPFASFYIMMVSWEYTSFQNFCSSRSYLLKIGIMGTSDEQVWVIAGTKFYVEEKHLPLEGQLEHTSLRHCPQLLSYHWTSGLAAQSTLSFIRRACCCSPSWFVTGGKQ